MTTKQLDIKNKTYYFYNDLINVSNVEPGNLKLHKKSWKDIDIYCIGYVNHQNEPSEWKINSVNTLYLMINRIFCFAGEKDGVKYLKIDKRIGNHADSILNKWNQVFVAIEYHIKKISVKEVNFDNDFDKIKFITDDNLPLEKLIYFPTLTVVIMIRCVLEQDLFLSSSLFR